MNSWLLYGLRRIIAIGEVFYYWINFCFRCGNVAAILELDENLAKYYKIFDAAPQVNFLFGFIFLGG